MTIAYDPLCLLIVVQPSENGPLLVGQGLRANEVALMLHRLQQLPWRRIDVSFKGCSSPFGLAHNNIVSAAAVRSMLCPVQSLYGSWSA